MSAIEYNSLVFKISQRVDELNILSHLRFMFRGRLASGSEDNIHDALSLFKELEELNILGADRLVEMKELLSNVEEWSLLEEVEKFESKRKEYRDLLEQTILALDELNELERLTAMCRGKISEESEGRIQDVRSLFKELENQNNLGIYHLDILKVILAEIENNELLKKVEKFEERRKQEAAIKRKKGKATALLSSVGNTLTGVLNIKTVFKVVAGGITVVSTMELLSRWNTFDQLVTAVNTCVLPAGTSLMNVTDGCVCLTVKADTLSALTTLWNLYQDGTLERRLYNFFVTDEVKERVGEETVEVNVSIEEEEYDKARLELMNEAQAQGTEDIERPRNMCRRNSDSSLYCKARDEATAQSKGGAETKHLDSEKYEFVQSYLQNIQETHSMTTETTDSGIRTHGEPSDAEMQVVSDHSLQLCLEHLSTDVILKLNARLAGDQVASRLIYESFGIKHAFHRSMSIFKLFPDTPVKLFKDVLEALQLYDLVELLEKSQKPPPLRSLRPALPIQDIEKLRQSSNPRPTTYHSNVAVLIVTDKKSHHTEGIERFFKGFSSKSDVTVFERQTQAYDVFRSQLPVYELQSQLSTPPWMNRLLNKRDLRRKEQEARKEEDTDGVAVSAVIERWIHNQGNFSLFAVFLFVTRHDVLAESETDWVGIMKKLVSGIPDKIKFLVGSNIAISVPESSESLVVVDPFARYSHLERLMLDILNKRWQTLDLISIMGELKRSANEELNLISQHPVEVFVGDSLSSCPRLKKEDDLTDCA